MAPRTPALSVVGVDLEGRVVRVVLESDTLFPRLPSAGIAVDF